MPDKPLNPRDFTVQDEFGRSLEFYTVGEKYMRRDLSIYAATGVVTDVKSVSKFVYANMWLDLCLKEL